MIRLALAQQDTHLLGIEQPRNAQEVHFVVAADGTTGAEFAAVEKHFVKGRLRLKRFKFELLQSIGGFFLPVSLLHL